MSRGLFTMSDVAAGGVRRNDPAAHERQIKDGYIKGVAGNRARSDQRQHARRLACRERVSRCGSILFGKSRTTGTAP